MTKQNKSRRFCFTINNYTGAELDKLNKIAKSLEKHRYICYGLEVAPTTKTIHIQGYIEFKDAQRLTFIQNYFNFQRDNKLHKFHVDVANGTAEQNKAYCIKEGIAYYEFGEPASQGKRTDMIEIKLLIKESPKDLNKIIDEKANNFQQLKFAQAIQPIYLSQRDPNFPPTVYWIFGPTGVGKTSLVYRTFDDVCSVSSPRWAGTGYSQNECLLFDDFRPSDIPFNDLLKITDRYPYTLERKHGDIPLNSPFIIFTTPKSIRDVFRTFNEDITQLERRVIQIHLSNEIEANSIDLHHLDSKYIHGDVNDYKRWW